MKAWRVLWWASAWILAVAVLGAAGVGHVDGSGLVDGIQVTPVVADGRVSVSFAAPASFDADAGEIVRSGLLLTFAFTVELRKPSTVWMDRTLGVATVSSTVKYDNLTNVFHASKLEGARVVWSDRTEDVAQVRAWMTSFDRVPVLSREPLEPNAEYYVRVRLQVSPKRTFSYWPWAGDAASGRADFTFIR